MVCERQAGEQFHHDEWMPAIFAKIEDGHDVPMSQLAGDFRLAIEALANLRLLLEVGHHHFDRDSPVDRLVDCGVDHAHGALADPFDDLVASDVLRHAARYGGFSNN